MADIAQEVEGTVVRDPNQPVISSSYTEALDEVRLFILFWLNDCSQ